MSAYVRQLIDGEDNNVYPVTKASAVYLDNGLETVQQALDDISSKNQKIEFPSGNQIKKTLDSGNIITTVFNNDGTITETTTTEAGVVISKLKTTFNLDGSIVIEEVE